VERDGAKSLTAVGYVVGTPGYMSPEQVRSSKALDARTDVYSLGVVLFEIMAGRLPFEGRTDVDVLAKILTEPVPRPTSVARLRVAVPDEGSLERICMKAMSKEAGDRHPTARALAEDLTRWLCGEEVLPPEAPSPPVLRPRITRRRRRLC
jgi:serine/threonine protein kinase